MSKFVFTYLWQCCGNRGKGIQGPVALTVGVVLGPVLNLSKSFQINCVKRW